MDAAQRRLSDFADEHRRDVAPVLHPEDLAKILQLRPQLAPEPPRRERSRSVTAGDISDALSLVHEAAASIRDADERIRNSEGRSQALLQRAAEEVRAADARALAAEARAQAAETRANEAQARAEEAENWLRQIFATISEELPPRR